MKRWAALLALLPGMAFAGPGMLGTKVDAVSSSPGAPVGVMAVVQMVVALVIVIALVRYVLPKVLAKITGTPASSDAELKVKSSTNLGSGTLHIVEAGGRTFLLGATAAQITCLADLSENEPEPFFPQAEIPTKSKADESFDQVLSSATTGGPGHEVAQVLARIRALEE